LIRNDSKDIYNVKKIIFQINAVFLSFLFIIESMRKCISFHKNTIRLYYIYHKQKNKLYIYILAYVANIFLSKLVSISLFGMT